MIWAIGEDKIYDGHVGARILLYQMTSVSVRFNYVYQESFIPILNMCFNIP